MYLNQGENTYNHYNEALDQFTMKITRQCTNEDKVTSHVICLFLNVQSKCRKKGRNHVKLSLLFFAAGIHSPTTLMLMCWNCLIIQRLVHNTKRLYEE